jgi:5'-nucleotidase
VAWLKESDKEFLFLTNSSERSPDEVRGRLAGLGIDVESSRIYTSALATASFVKSQLPASGSAYVLGAPGLIAALYQKGVLFACPATVVCIAVL